MGATTDRARLRWFCRRGMKELDELLLRFVQNGLEQAPPAVERAFRELLEYPDPELYALVCGRADPADPAQADVIARIRRTADPRG